VRKEGGKKEDGITAERQKNGKKGKDRKG